MLAKFIIAFFTKHSRSDPSFRLINSFLAIIRFTCFTLRQNPADHGELIRSYVHNVKCFAENLFRGPVKWTDNLLVCLIERVISFGETNERICPGFIILLVFQSIFRRVVNEISYGSCNPFVRVLHLSGLRHFLSSSSFQPVLSLMCSHTSQKLQLPATISGTIIYNYLLARLTREIFKICSIDIT